jgi:hypothetical protein
MIYHDKYQNIDVEILDLKLYSTKNGSQIRINDKNPEIDFVLFILNRDNKEVLRHNQITNLNTKEYDFLTELMQLTDRYNLDLEIDLKLFKRM